MDPERLVLLGFLTEEREAEGRRRRTYPIQADVSAFPATAFALATVQMGIAYERVAMTFWADIMAHPPAPHK